MVVDIGGGRDDGIDFLEAIDKEYFISFEEFDFKKYFHDEAEISKAVLGLGIFYKPRKIKHQLTVKGLYDYITSHRSNNYENWV